MRCVVNILMLMLIEDIKRLWLGGGYYGAPVVLEVTDTMQYRYVMRDHLGSITHVYTAEPIPTLLQELSYDAWGRLRNPDTHEAYASDSVQTPILGRGYTGHRHIAGIGLIDMNARLYDPMLGRFLSPDPHIQSPDCPQNYNRYSYCLNNPLRYTDPTGETYYTTTNKFEIERFLRELKYGNANRVLNNYNFSNWTKYNVLLLSVNSPNGVAYLTLMPSSKLSVSIISSDSFEMYCESTDYEVIVGKIRFSPYSFYVLPLGFDTSIYADSDVLKLPEWVSDANTLVGASSASQGTKTAIIKKVVDKSGVPSGLEKYVNINKKISKSLGYASIFYAGLNLYSTYTQTGMSTALIMPAVDLGMAIFGTWGGPWGVAISTGYYIADTAGAFNRFR